VLELTARQKLIAANFARTTP